MPEVDLSHCAKCGKNPGMGVAMRGGMRCHDCAWLYCIDCDQRPKAWKRTQDGYRFRDTRFCLVCLRVRQLEGRSIPQ